MQELPVMTVDFECRSFIDITKVGTWRYAEDPTTEVLCLSYKLGDEASKLWAPPLPFPKQILDHIEANGMFEAHNVQMERAVWMHILCKGRHMSVAGINTATPIPMPRRWKDTMAVCAHRSIPMSLDKAGAALALPVQKDKRGKYLIQTLCKPKWGTKAEPDRVYREDLELMDEMFDYCMMDTDAEHTLSWAIGDLPGPEYRLWILDQTINQRGVKLDMEAVECAISIAEKIETDANDELSVITGGEVTAGTQRDRVIKWLQQSGLRIIDLQKDTVETTIAGLKAEDLGYSYISNPYAEISVMIRVLEIRQISSKASTKKLYKMRETVCSDDRVRGTLQYHGAGTGRWAGRLVQPHNFPRGDMDVLGALNMDELIAYIRQPTDQAISDLDFMLNGKVIEGISSSLRGMIIPEEGKRLMVADFAAIEARVVMWMAWCEKALKAFVQYDKGIGPDIYCVMAQELYGRPINKKEDPDERQLGKVTILGCGYQMGVDTFIYQAEKDYGLILDRAMGEKAVYGYREAYPEVKKLWYGLENAAVQAVKTGKPMSYSCVTYRLEKDNAGTWLSCELPNNRKIWYYDPVVEESMVVKPWDRETGKKTLQLKLTYMGRDNKRGGMWSRVYTYGGMLTENCVQAIARDLMVEGMIRVEGAGYPIILTVHDEIISEVPLDHGDLETFNSLMAGPPPSWAPDCPVAVEGFEMMRYRKA